MTTTSTDERDRIIRRLRKVLALTNSSNAGEAAAALKQAAALMKKYGLDAVDAQASAINQSSASVSGAELPAWESALVGVIREAFQVEVVVEKYVKEAGWTRPRAKLLFLGEGHMAEIASYAFVFLRKRLKANMSEAVADLMKSQVQWSGRTAKPIKLTKIQREVYAFAWCQSALAVIKSLAPEREPTEESTPKRDEAMARQMLKLGVPDAVKAPPKKKVKELKLDALAAQMLISGHKSGQKVRLHKAVNQTAHLAKQLTLDIGSAQHG